MNTLDTLRNRDNLYKAIRGFFSQRNYLEVHTPTIVPQPGVEAEMEYFSTNLRGYRGETRELWLRSSPEVHMKTLLCQGVSDIYQLAPCFRNHGEYTPWHHPEFMMLEWYRKGISLTQMQEETHDLISDVYQHIGKKDLPPLIKITVGEAFKQYCNIDLIDKDPDLSKKAKALRLGSLTGHEDFETAFYKLQLEIIEPNIKSLKYVCLSHYPASLAILANIKDNLAQRFEFYLEGIELCNAYDELTDPHENQKRIKAALKRRIDTKKTTHGMDQEFLEAIKNGLPHCCGNALGVDRLLALALGLKSVEPLLPFRQQLAFPEYSDLASQD